MTSARPRRVGRAGLTVPYLPPSDLDYGASFQLLLKVQAEIRLMGADPARTLRRGHARLALADYLGAAFDAEHVIRVPPSHPGAQFLPEAQFLKGQAMLALAAMKHGVVRPGIGIASARLEASLPPRRDLALTAKHCFQLVLATNPLDAQAERALDAVDALLESLPPSVAPTAQ